MPQLARSLASLFLILWPTMVPAQSADADVGRIVAIGDVHGDYGQFVTLLRQTGLVDGKERWIGGRATLVQTGDVPDRGPDSRKVMELLMALTEQARKAGGRVVPLVGNHEAMNVLGDLRYVDPREYAAFRGPNSQKLQDRAWRILSDTARRDDKAYREQWLTEHPLGWVEQRMAFEGNGRYATWIRGNDAVVKVNDVLFLHGGISPKYVDSSIVALNAGVRTALSGSSAPTPGNMAEDEEGPLWYRGLANGDEALLASHVDSVLRRYGVKHIVIGHTTTPGAIMPRFGGKVIMIDVGLSSAYGANQAALVVEHGAFFAMHRGKKLELPLGSDPFTYLEAAAALEPAGSRLKQWVDQMVGTPK